MKRVIALYLIVPFIDLVLWCIGFTDDNGTLVDRPRINWRPLMPFVFLLALTACTTMKIEATNNSTVTIGGDASNTANKAHSIPTNATVEGLPKL